MAAGGGRCRRHSFPIAAAARRSVLLRARERGSKSASCLAGVFDQGGHRIQLIAGKLGGGAVEQGGNDLPRRLAEEGAEKVLQGGVLGVGGGDRREVDVLQAVEVMGEMSLGDESPQESTDGGSGSPARASAAQPRWKPMLVIWRSRLLGSTRATSCSG